MGRTVRQTKTVFLHIRQIWRSHPNRRLLNETWKYDTKEKNNIKINFIDLWFLAVVYMCITCQYLYLKLMAKYNGKGNLYFVDFDQNLSWSSLNLGIRTIISFKYSEIYWKAVSTAIGLFAVFYKECDNTSHAESKLNAGKLRRYRNQHVPNINDTDVENFKFSGPLMFIFWNLVLLRTGNLCFW